MKLLKGNGRTLEIWELGDMVMKLRSTNGIPIKFHGWQIMEDADAREAVRSAMANGAAVSKEP